MSRLTKYVQTTKILVWEVRNVRCPESNLAELGYNRLWSQSPEAARESNEWNYHWNICDCTSLNALKSVVQSIQIQSGTAILLKPGIIAGGSLQHECPLSRSIGYFLEPIIMLAPFAKKPINLTIKGITTDEHDLSVRPSFSIVVDCDEQANWLYVK